MMVTGAYRHPLICGHEFMGAIEEPAPDSAEFKKGDKVAAMPIIGCGTCPACGGQDYFHCPSYNFLGSRTDGGFAEYCLVPTKNLFRLPMNADERVGAFLEPISVALHVVKRSGFISGGRALVFGAGAIGLLTGMWLKILGASEVAIADIRSESIQIARQAGFEKVFDPRGPEFQAEKEFDYVFEAAGANPALLGAIEKVRQKGTVTIVGRDTKDTTIPLKYFETLMRKEIEVRGCWGYNNSGLEGLIYDCIQKGQFNFVPLITAKISLKEGENVIRKMFNREIFFCKVLFTL
jgi:L-iditol 2-dehydrogenase